jgi:hypothetical protein
MKLRFAPIVCGVALAIARPAFAGDASCDYVEIKATADGAIDPSLAALKSKLQQPPFNGWKGFTLLKQGTVALTKGKAQALALKVGAGSVLLRDRDAKQVALAVTIDGGDGTRLVDTKSSIALGDWLLLGDNKSSSKEGHIVGLTCK